MKNVILAILTITTLSACGFEQVDEGYRGIKTTWGRVEGEPLTPGLHFYNPVSSGIFEMSVKEEKLEGATQAFTSDTQNTGINYAITFYPDPKKIGHLYSQFGSDWEAKVIPQVVLGAMKDVVGQYTADTLVSKRESATKTAEAAIKEALSRRDVTVTRLDITNLDFADEYEKAVESKVTAVQLANAEKNKTVQVQEQAKQTLETAKASAEAMRIKSQALSQNKGLTGYEIATRWDGKLPQIMLGSGSMPMIDLKALNKEE